MPGPEGEVNDPRPDAGPDRVAPSPRFRSTPPSLPAVASVSGSSCRAAHPAAPVVSRSGGRRRGEVGASGDPRRPAGEARAKYTNVCSNNERCAGQRGLRRIAVGRRWRCGRGVARGSRSVGAVTAVGAGFEMTRTGRRSVLPAAEAPARRSDATAAGVPTDRRLSWWCRRSDAAARWPYPAIATAPTAWRAGDRRRG